MNTTIIDAKERLLTKEELSYLKETIKSGGLVIFPTETVYGLGANALSPTAAEKVYAAKGRPSNNPLIIHIKNPEDAEKFCKTNEIYKSLAKEFMPGPLTVILEKKDIIPFEVTGGLDTVAVRCPAHPIALQLIGECGLPIAAPSANLSGRPSPTSAKYCIEDMDGRVDAIIDGGESEIGLESTIVMPKDDGRILLLRPGAITPKEISKATGCKVEIAEGVLEEPEKDATPLSPGMLYKHYAPKTEFVLLSGSDEEIFAFLKEEKNSIFLGFDGDEKSVPAGVTLINIGKRNEPLSTAHRIFASLREADKQNKRVIFARLPGTDGVELALYNRMIRASAHRIHTLKRN